MGFVLFKKNHGAYGRGLNLRALAHGRRHLFMRTLEVGQKQFRELKFHSRRDSSGRPVVDPLNAAVLVKPKEFSHLRGASKGLNELLVGLHKFRLLTEQSTLNTMFIKQSTPRETTDCLVQAPFVRMNEMHEQAKRLYEAAKSLAGLFTQSEVAARMNVSPQMVNNWEKRGVSSDGMIRAEEVFGCSPAWLKTGKGQMVRVTDGDIVKMSAMTREVAAIMESLSEVNRAVVYGVVLGTASHIQSGDKSPKAANS